MEPGSAQGVEGRIAVTADGLVGDAVNPSAKHLLDGIGAVADDPEYASRIGGDGVLPRHTHLEPELADPRILDLALGRTTEIPDPPDRMFPNALN